MKKKSLQKLALKKRTISDFSNSVKGGQVASSNPPTTVTTPTVTVTIPTTNTVTITFAGCTFGACTGTITDQDQL